MDRQDSQASRRLAAGSGRSAVQSPPAKIGDPSPDRLALCSSAILSGLLGVHATHTAAHAATIRHGGRRVLRLLGDHGHVAIEAGGRAPPEDEDVAQRGFLLGHAEGQPSLMP